MRGEVQAVLHQQGIECNELIVLDEVFAHAAKNCSALHLVLVDHNELSGRWRRKYPQVPVVVEAIVDHHADAGQFPEASPRIITTCGSTTSLLVHQTAHANLDGRHSSVMDRLKELAPLMLKTIIFDTVNLTWRQTLVDEEAVQKLQLLLASEAPLADSIMQELRDAVEAVPESSFGIFDLLYKDYKLYFCHSPSTGRDIYYGISTLHLSFESMMHMTNHDSIRAWHEEVRRFMESEEIELLIVIDAIYKEGASSHSQQLGLFTPDHVMLQQLTSCLQDKKCALSPIYEGDTFALYNQANIAISRKQFHPIMKDFMSRHYQ